MFMSATSQCVSSYVSCDATVAVPVFGFCSCSPLLGQALVHMGLTAVAAVRYSVRTDRCSGPGSPVHSWAFPGSDCKLAFDWGLRVDMAWSYWHCKCFEKELGDTGRWVGEE